MGMPCASAKREDFGFGGGLGDAVAGEDDGFLRLLDEGDGVADGARTRRGAWDAGGGAWGRRTSKEKGAVACWASLVMSTRTGPGRPLLRDLEGEADGGSDVFGAGDEEVVLGDGEGDAGDVDFLEGVGAEDFGRDLAGDRDDGDRVEHGGGEAGDEVGGAGAGGGHADADAAGRAGVAVGHVGGSLLVADEDVVDGGEFAEGVVDGEDGAAGVAEDGGGAFAGEGGPEDFGSGELRGGCQSSFDASHSLLLEPFSEIVIDYAVGFP